MNIIPLTGHEAAWDQFCLDRAWFWHTTLWQSYVLCARFGVTYRNHSFALEQDGAIVGIVPLIQEDDQFTFQGGATPEYICRPEHEKAVLAEIRRLALANGVKRIHIRGNVKGYLDASTYTCVLDLADVRPTKGHRAAIKKSEKYLQYREITDIDRFKNDYFAIAGKATRPDATFDHLRQWIRQGHGTLLEASFEDDTAGYAYLLHWNSRAYYLMSCTVPYYRRYNVSHFLQAKAFDILRAKGIHVYELGEQVYNSLHSQPTEKERNISLFKRNFGGKVVISPASEYFFDADYCREVMAERVKNYIRSEFNV